ncbi:MAG: hypothetical protein HY247_07885 [archaeon]|nr:MAG: hypothetical protein HY247_07885 [archaeon]
MSGASKGELLFVVDVSRFTRAGFSSTATYKGKRLDLHFDDQDEGIFLTSEMAKKLAVRKGSKVSVLLQDDVNEQVVAKVAGVGASFRVSLAKVYYAIGKEGGAVMKVSKA